jgi:hypothetical protein
LVALAKGVDHDTPSKQRASFKADNASGWRFVPAQKRNLRRERSALGSRYRITGRRAAALAAGSGMLPLPGGHWTKL